MDSVTFLDVEYEGAGQPRTSCWGIAEAACAQVAPAPPAEDPREAYPLGLGIDDPEPAAPDAVGPVHEIHVRNRTGGRVTVWVTLAEAGPVAEGATFTTKEGAQIYPPPLVARIDLGQGSVGVTHEQAVRLLADGHFEFPLGGQEMDQQLVLSRTHNGELVYWDYGLRAPWNEHTRDCYTSGVLCSWDQVKDQLVAALM